MTAFFSFIFSFYFYFNLHLFDFLAFELFINYFRILRFILHIKYFYIRHFYYLCNILLSGMKSNLFRAAHKPKDSKCLINTIFHIQESFSFRSFSHIEPLFVLHQLQNLME